MAIEISLTGYPSGATDVYAYYVGRTLASYVTDKVLFVEGTGPDTGLYTATVDESKGTSIVAFVGAAQPASWAEALVGVSWDLSAELTKAEVDKIQRSATAVPAGEVWAESNAAIAAKVISDTKADPQLGTADGGLVANVGKIPRAATPKADGEAVTRNKVGTATASTLTETLS